MLFYKKKMPSFTRFPSGPLRLPDRLLLHHLWLLPLLRLCLPGGLSPVLPAPAVSLKHLFPKKFKMYLTFFLKKTTLPWGFQVVCSSCQPCSCPGCFQSLGASAFLKGSLNEKNHGGPRVKVPIVPGRLFLIPVWSALRSPFDVHRATK